MSSATRWAALILTIAVLLAGAWGLRVSQLQDAPASAGRSHGPVAVETARVERGPIEQRRELTGTLEATAEIVVAPKVGGRLDRITVDLGDPVQRGQVVAQLDDEELAQAQAQAKADLAVVQARKVAAGNALQIAERNLERVQGLRKRGIASEQELDTTREAKLQAEATVAVAASEIMRAKAALRGAEVRKGYTQVSVDWRDGASQRVVAARHVDDGTMVGANTPLLTIVGLDPLVVAVHVTEQDYGPLRVGLPITLTTDAHPGEEFSGQVARIAPVFAAQSRQARVELEVANPDGRLRPGMFVRVQVVLARIESTTLVPRDALVTHDAGGDVGGGAEDEGPAVFVVADDGQSARLQPVTVGMSDGVRVQVEGVAPPQEVVTLGQSQLEDGGAIVRANPGQPEESSP